MPVLRIETVDDPRLAVYRDLKSPLAKRRGELFVVESWLLTERLLTSGLRVASVLVEERLVESVLPLVTAETPVFVVPRALVQQLIGFRFHRGVLACGYRPVNADLRQVLSSLRPPLACASGYSAADPDLRQALSSQVPRRATLMVCVGIQDPENLGSILRTSAAFGVSMVLLGPHCADPFSRRVARTSMGANFRLPVVESLDLQADLLTLRDEFGVRLVATVLGSEAQPLPEVAVEDRHALLFGSEGHGLDQRWVELCDLRVTIPMRPAVDSLNVSVAAGVVLYHFSR